MLMSRTLALLFAVACSGLFAESVDDRIKATDMSDPEAVFALAQWCSENGQPSKSRKYYNVVIRLEPNHWGAREALGQVEVNGRWVSAKMVEGGPANTAPAAAAGGSGRKAGGPGPTAAQVEWNLKPPTDPKPDFTWIDQYINRMNTIGNDSRDMDVSVATCVSVDHVAVAVPRLCKAMTSDGWTDLYGPSMIAMELMRAGKFSQAKSLLPFMAKASERCRNEEDLATFGFVVGSLKEKKVVPRLIELLGDASEEVQDGARDGLTQLTMLPAQDITVENAKRWWDTNHNVSNQDIFRDQLRSDDARTALEAAKALYEYRDHDIVPVLAKLLRSDDLRVRGESIEIIKRISGSDWSFKLDGEPAEWKKRSDEVLAWWKENEFRHTWIEDQGKPAGSGEPDNRPDPFLEQVQKLGSVAGNEASAAEASLVGAGKDALPAILGGLDDGNRILRRKAYDVLCKITRHNLPYDAAGADDVRHEQIAAWTAWLTEQGMLPGGDEVGDDGEAVVPQAPQPEGKPAPKRMEVP